MTKYEKLFKRLEENKRKRTELKEAVCGYIMVAKEDTVLKIIDLINEEENHYRI